MRATVIVSEYLILVPAAVIFIRHMSKLCGITTWESSVALTAVLMQPATMLIDHGHFQYNTVMLGLMLASMSSMLAGRHLWSCVYFVAALGFKQMALFYAPAVFAYLLGICVFPRINIGRLLSIAVVTTVSFVALFLPFLLGVAHDSWKGVFLPFEASTPPLLQSLPVQLSTKAWYYPLVFQLAQSIHLHVDSSRIRWRIFGAPCTHLEFTNFTYTTQVYFLEQHWDSPVFQSCHHAWLSFSSREKSLYHGR